MTVSDSHFVTIIMAKNDDFNLIENLKISFTFYIINVTHYERVILPLQQAWSNSKHYRTHNHGFNTVKGIVIISLLPSVRNIQIHRRKYE